MASERAREAGLDVVLGGRSEGKVRELATSLSLPYRVFPLDATRRIDDALEDITVLLNAAGPYIHTAGPLIKACIRNKVHYLDIAAELDGYRLAEELDKEAKDAGVMLMPGCGGSVAMLGCLAGYAVERVKDPVSIEVALRIDGSMSRGSAISAAENVTTVCLQSSHGSLVGQDARDRREFDFDDGEGPVACIPLTLPDLITIWKSTSVDSIKTYVHVAGGAFPTGDLAALPNGPTEGQRETTPYHASVVVTAEDGTVRRAVLHTVNGYSFTPAALVKAARRAMTGEIKGGFQTPAGLFGPSFVESVLESKMKPL